MAVVDWIVSGLGVVGQAIGIILLVFLARVPTAAKPTHAARDRARNDAAHLAVPWFRD